MSCFRFARDASGRHVNAPHIRTRGTRSWRVQHADHPATALVSKSGACTDANDRTGNGTATGPNEMG
ncbi:hypothetical protein MTO96_022214 [Rhipicephalus appendiculatus]